MWSGNWQVLNLESGSFMLLPKEGNGAGFNVWFYGLTCVSPKMYNPRRDESVSIISYRDTKRQV